MALAIECDRLIREGVIKNQSELAHYAQVTTARMTHIMWLTNLDPEIQEAILSLPRVDSGPDTVKEIDVRRIARVMDWGVQREASERLSRSFECAALLVLESNSITFARLQTSFEVGLVFSPSCLNSFRAEQTSSPCKSSGHIRCLKPIHAASQTERRVLAPKSPKCSGKQKR